MSTILANLWTSIVLPELASIAGKLETEAQAEITTALGKIDAWIQAEVSKL
jgi:hypothetical protein